MFKCSWPVLQRSVFQLSCRKIESLRSWRSCIGRPERIPDRGCPCRAGTVSRIKPWACVQQICLLVRSHEDLQTEVQVRWINNLNIILLELIISPRQLWSINSNVVLFWQSRFRKRCRSGRPRIEWQLSHNRQRQRSRAQGTWRRKDQRDSGAHRLHPRCDDGTEKVRRASTRMGGRTTFKGLWSK